MTTHLLRWHNPADTSILDPLAANNTDTLFAIANLAIDILTPTAHKLSVSLCSQALNVLSCIKSQNKKSLQSNKVS